MTKKSKSYAVRKAAEIWNEPIKELDGLSMGGIKVLHFFISELAGFAFYKIEVFYEREPKEIVIRTFTKDGQEFFIRPKNFDILDALPGKIGAPGYKVRFATKGDSFEV